MLEEFKALTYEYNAFQYANPLEVAEDPSKNYYLFNNKLMDFSLKVYVVFDKDVHNKLEELRNLCLEKYKKQNELWKMQRKIGLWHECVGDTLGSKEDFKKEEDRLTQELVSFSTKILFSWGPIYTSILKIIQSGEV